jgi:hypothetical protein
MRKKWKIDEKMYTFQKSIYKTRQRRFPEYRQKMARKKILCGAETFETEVFGWKIGAKTGCKAKIDRKSVFALCFCK